MQVKPHLYPFCAVVGQERAQKALLLHAVNPGLKGVLLAGPPGTAKSTLIHGVTELLPELNVINIPLNVDEERLWGDWDMAAAVRSGKRTFVPGLLAAADGHIVTVDNAHIMPERLMKAILTAGDNVAGEPAHGHVRKSSERRSGRDSAAFHLFAAMSPDDGRPLPAMFDRCGLYVRLETSTDLAERTDIASRLLAFEQDPESFRLAYESETKELRARIAAARTQLPAVHIDGELLRLAAEIAEEAGCLGQRADIVLIEAARTIAAWEGLSETTQEHLQEAAGFVLPHRMRAASYPEESRGKSPVDLPDQEPTKHDSNDDHPSPGSHRDKESQRESQAEGENNATNGEQVDRSQFTSPAQLGGDHNGEADSRQSLSLEARAVVEAVGREIAVQPFVFTPPQPMKQAQTGKRNQASVGTVNGRYVRAAMPRGPLRDIAFDATLRMAAPFQLIRKQQLSSNNTNLKLWIEPSDVRVKVRENKTGTALLFVVDASGSMNANKRMKAVKGAVLSLLRDAYRQRDHVGLIAFRDQQAELLLGLTRSVELAERKLRTLPAGGKTPLGIGLEKGLIAIRPLLNRRSGLIPAMIVMTDGKANVSAEAAGDPWQESLQAAQRIAAAGIRTLVIDTEDGVVRFGYARKLAEAMQARYYRLEELDANNIERAVRTLI